VNDIHWQQKLGFVSPAPRWVITHNSVSVSGVTVNNAPPHNKAEARIAFSVSTKIDFVVSKLHVAKLSGTHFASFAS
jgi:NAD-dependent DNA ligase